MTKGGKNFSEHQTYFLSSRYLCNAFRFLRKEILEQKRLCYCRFM